MKKGLFLLLFMSGLAEAAPSPVQIHAALTQVMQMQSSVNELESFLVQADGLAQNGYSYAVRGSTNTVAITQAQLQDLTASFQSQKAQIQAQLNALP